VEDMDVVRRVRHGNPELAKSKQLSLEHASAVGHAACGWAFRLRIEADVSIRRNIFFFTTFWAACRRRA